MENPAITRTMGLKAWTMIAALSVLWGAAFFFVAIAVREWPPVTVALCRTGGAALVLWPAIYLIGQRMALDATLWRAFFIMGLLNNVIPFLLNFWGQTHIASGVAAILNATSPLFTALVAHALTQDEKMGARHLAGVLLGLAGVAVMVGGEALLQSGASLWPVLGQIAIVAAAISYSFGGVFGRRFRSLGVTPMQTATGQVTASSAIILPLALIVDQPWTLPAPSLSAALSLTGLAVLSTALAYILYFRVIATAGATNAMLVTFLIPVSAILLGVMFLGETLASRHIAGMALIAAGLIAIDGRLLPRRA